MFGLKLVRQHQLYEMQEAYNRHVHELEVRYLHAHLREIANIILEKNPHKFLECFHKLKSCEEGMRLCSMEKFRQEFKLMTSKYPFHSDFELLGTKHWVSYQAATDFLGFVDDACERYLDIGMYLILAQKIKGGIQILSFSEVDEELLQRQLKKESYFKVQVNLHDAERRANTYLSDDQQIYEDDDYVVTLISESGTKNRGFVRAYGVQFKNNEESYILGLNFSSDVDLNKKSYSYLRTNNQFDENFDFDFKS